MSFNIYPDADTAALLGKPVWAPISLGPGEAMRKFVPLADHVGLDPVMNVPTTFIRIAMSGGPQVLQPKFELLARDPDRPGGSPAPLLDPDIAVSPITAVPLYDNVNHTGAAAAYFSPPFRDNVYLLKVVIEIPGTRLWIRITNTARTNAHDDGHRSFVWAVADSDADALQPWIHATFHGAVPANIRFNATVGQTPAQPVEINNFGTGPFTLSNVAPALTSPYTISGLPLTLGPSASAKVTVGFNAITSGDLAPVVFSFVTTRNRDSGPFGPGHNNQFILSAHTSSNVWVTKAPMPTPRSGFGVAAASNGKLYAVGGYVFGGHADAPALRTIEEYDPATNHWTSLRWMPTSRSYLQVAGAGNGKLYVFGGSGDDAQGRFTHFRTVEEYDPATDDWTTKAPMPAMLYDGAAAAANGKIYCVGSGGTTTLGEYDPASDTWTVKAPMPTKRSGFGLAVAGNGKLYAVGGSSDVSDGLTTVEEYDPVTDRWTTKAPMPTRRQRLGLAVANGGKLYAAGGTPMTRTVEEYDPAADSWTTKAPMLANRAGLGLAMGGNGRLYAIGGEDTAALSSSVEEFMP